MGTEPFYPAVSDSRTAIYGNIMSVIHIFVQELWEWEWELGDGYIVKSPGLIRIHMK